MNEQLTNFHGDGVWRFSYYDEEMGAFYHRSFAEGKNGERPGPAEQMILPAYVIEKLGYIPPPEIARLILEQREIQTS